LDVNRLAMPLLFSLLTAAFAVIAVASASHGMWVIAVAAGAIGLWMASFTWAALRRMRR
jgi:succinate-acetate transporter protein